MAMRILLNTKPLSFSKKTGIGSDIDNSYRGLLALGTDIVPTLNAESLTFIDTLWMPSSRLRSLIGKRYPAFIGKMGDAFIDAFISGRGILMSTMRQVSILYRQ